MSTDSTRTLRASTTSQRSKVQPKKRKESKSKATSVLKQNTSDVDQIALVEPEILPPKPKVGITYKKRKQNMSQKKIQSQTLDTLSNQELEERLKDDEVLVEIMPKKIAADEHSMRGFHTSSAQLKKIMPPDQIYHMLDDINTASTDDYLQEDQADVVMEDVHEKTISKPIEATLTKSLQIHSQKTSLSHAESIKLDFNQNSPSQVLYSMMQTKSKSVESTIKTRITINDLTTPEMKIIINQMENDKKQIVLYMFDQFQIACDYLQSQGITIHPDEHQLLLDFILSSQPFNPSMCPAVLYGYRRRRLDMNEDNSKIANKLIEAFKTHDVNLKERSTDLMKQIDNLRNAGNVLQNAVSKIVNPGSKKQAEAVVVPSKAQIGIASSSVTIDVDAMPQTGAEQIPGSSQIPKKQKTDQPRPLSSYQELTPQNVRAHLGQMLSILPTDSEGMKEFVNTILRELNISWAMLAKLKLGEDTLIKLCVQVCSLHLEDIFHPFINGEKTAAQARQAFVQALKQMADNVGSTIVKEG